TVKPDAVPADEKLRTWLVYPRETPSQRDVVFIRSNPEQHYIAPNTPIEGGGSPLQRTIYLERDSVAGEPTLFEVEFEYTSYARCEFVDPAAVKPYDMTSALYR